MRSFCLRPADGGTHALPIAPESHASSWKPAGGVEPRSLLAWLLTAACRAVAPISSRRLLWLALVLPQSLCADSRSFGLSRPLAVRPSPPLVCRIYTGVLRVGRLPGGWLIHQSAEQPGDDADKDGFEEVGGSHCGPTVSSTRSNMDCNPCSLYRPSSCQRTGSALPSIMSHPTT